MLDKTIVIIPSLDPDEHLVQTVEGLKAAGFKRFVLVDDGSDEEHKKNFPEPSDSIAVLHHEKNKGKGAALKTAFSYIAETLPDAKYMVTVDGDGQHDVNCVENIITPIRGGVSLVIGSKQYTYSELDISPESNLYVDSSVSPI